LTAETVIVTGVTTFLGCHIARAFAAAGYRVVGTFNTPPGKLDPLRRARWERVRDSLAARSPLDVTDPNQTQRLVMAEQPRLWIHQAGLGRNFASERYDLAEANRINLLPLDAIFLAMAKTGGAVLITGSGMEYGAIDCPHIEDAACWPESPYGLARLAATLRARQLAHRHRVPTRVVRVYTIFGELDGLDRLVMRLFRQLRCGARIGIAPGVSRDICDVADLADGYLRLAADCLRGPIFDIFNLSRGVAMPLFDLAQIAARQLGADPRLIFEDPSMLRPEEPPILCGDSHKALVRLGWAPRPIAEGLKRLAAEDNLFAEVSAASHQA
jgi:nucleoside-diphosphate-sugar epimerase